MAKSSKRSLRKRKQIKLDAQLERKFFLIICEGKSEVKYFGHYRAPTGPEIELVGKGCSHTKLIREAIDRRNKEIEGGTYNEEVDSTWAVFDRDVDLQKPNDKNSFIQALDLAQKNNIEVAYSNDSFELWFLLHFQDVTTEIHRKDVDKKLKEVLRRDRKCKYDHGVDFIEKSGLDLVGIEYEEAVKRAQQLLGRAEKEGKFPVDANPSTTVHVLTEKLRKTMKEN